MEWPTTAYPNAPQPHQWLEEGVHYVRWSESPTLFCWAIALADTVEPWLLVEQLHRATGIFGCHKYSVFSDKELSLGEGPQGWGAVNATPIPGKPAWQGPAPGTDQLIWHNTGVFTRAYRRIYSDALYKKYDWSVKADPDAAFIPAILQQKLQEKNLDSSTPIYFVNCEQWHSMQGPLEVFTRAAGDLFYGSHQQCLDSLPWGDWGEDWFANKCLDMLGVQGLDGFDLLSDMWCQDSYADTGHSYWEEFEQRGAPVCDGGRPAYHPYKTPEEMHACLEQAAPVHKVRVPTVVVK